LKKLPRNVSAPELLGKQADAKNVVHRRIEITVEREVTTAFVCPAPKHSVADGYCRYCGQAIASSQPPIVKQVSETPTSVDREVKVSGALESPVDDEPL
jgi:hypothetical protein